MSSSTQFTANPQGEACDLVIGFDFGTSCSKIVIQDLYQLRRAYAVALDGAGHASCRYLLPSVLWVGNGQRASLAPVKPGVCLRGIKSALMNQARVKIANSDHTVHPEVAAVAFLALALREARLWFIQQHRDLYQRFTLRWTFNLGLPSADFANTNLCASYGAVAKAAWWLSVRPEAITLAAAESALGSPDAASSLSEADFAEIHTIPEVAAEVAGYARTPELREEGLHVLVDIGASTLDVCGFVLHEWNGDKYELLTTDVQPLGAIALYEHRVEGVNQAVTGHVSDLWNRYDPVVPMPEMPHAYVPTEERISQLVQQQCDIHEKKCLQQMAQTVVDLKVRRNPRSPRWHSELPLFVAGGGSSIPFFQTSVEKLSQKFSQLYHFGGMRPVLLPKPDNLVADVDEPTYQRLAVAWGLSFENTDIGEVTRPGDIEDVLPPDAINVSEGFISKDQV